MYRTIFYIGFFMALYSGVGLLIPHASFYLTFLLPNGVAAAVGVFIGLLLLNFSVAGRFRKHRPKLLFGLAGVVLVGIAVFGLIDPSYFGLFKRIVRPATLLVELLSGVGLLIAALEYGRPTFQEEIGIEYHQYLHYLLVRPSTMLHAFRRRAELAVAALGANQKTISQ